MPLPLTVSCSSKIQIGFTFLVPAYLGSPGKRAVKRVCVCVCKYTMESSSENIIVNRLRFDRIMVMSLWPLLAHPAYFIYYHFSNMQYRPNSAIMSYHSFACNNLTLC